MGCAEMSDSNKPMLILDFQKGDNSQRAYLLKLTQKFKSERKIGFKLSEVNNKFSVQLHFNNKDYPVQDVFEDTEEKLEETLAKIYNLLK